MIRFFLSTLAVTASLLLLSGSLFAGTSRLETEYENQFRKQLRAEQVVDLNSLDGDFVGIFRDSASSAARGGVVIVHDLNQNANSPHIIRPLAEKLSAHGWASLSLQMPVPLLDDSTSPLPQLDRLFADLSRQSTARIEAGINHMLSKNIEHISIVGVGIGAKYAVNLMTSPQGEKAINLVVVNLDSRHPPEMLQALEKLAIPVLDVYGSRGLPAVTESREERSSATIHRADNSNYRQVEIEGADQRFTGLENALIITIRAWLGKHSPID